MACQVIRNPATNEIMSVLAPNGAVSKLYDKILSLPEVEGDKETAALIWAHTYTDTFRAATKYGLRLDPNGESEIVDIAGQPFFIVVGVTEVLAYPVYSKASKLIGLNNKYVRRMATTASEILSSRIRTAIKASTTPPTTIRHALRNIKYYSGTVIPSEHKTLAEALEKVFNVMGDYDVPLYYINPTAVDPDWVFDGAYSPMLNAVTIREDQSLKRTAEVVIHEAVHVITNSRLYSDPEFALQVAKLMDASDVLKEEFPYAFTNEHEFLSEAMSNVKFQKALNEIPNPNGETV